MAKIGGHSYAKGLTTVCREARCPNQGECFNEGTATFMILGDRCTRNCAFCAVRHGVPDLPDAEEPRVVAQAVVALGLKHAVVTSVTRDDLPDGGARHFADTIRAIRSAAEGTGIEVLIPDFQGSDEALRVVIDAAPDVINHNLETVPRLYPQLRKGADYRRSLGLLRRVKELAPAMVTKSGIMVGAGEYPEEILLLIRDLVIARCSALTIGQYLQPSESHHPVERYVTPEEFQELTELAKAEGIRHVVGGPLVRSSYRAGETVDLLRNDARR